eukprot:12065339-Alexandrium_andersonii.AAC.1
MQPYLNGWGQHTPPEVPSPVNSAYAPRVPSMAPAGSAGGSGFHLPNVLPHSGARVPPPPPAVPAPQPAPVTPPPAQR